MKLEAIAHGTTVPRPRPAPGRRVRVMALLAVAASLPSPARGNSAAPLDYDVTVSATTVRVCPAHYHPDQDPCGKDGLLRRDTRTGAVVVLASCAEPGCFVDECVPPGAYQYGLRTPFQCCSACSGTYAYADATTVSSIDGCARTQPAPEPYGAAVPWGDDKLICGYKGTFGCGTPAGAGAVLGGNAIVLLAGLGLAGWRRRGRRPRAR